jgi:hypothetical protein
MDTPPPLSPRQRLQQLLAIPERARTDAQWDEINELEIGFASANRQGTPEPGARRDGPPGGQPRPGGNPRGKRPFRKFHKGRPGGGAS